MWLLKEQQAITTPISQLRHLMAKYVSTNENHRMKKGLLYLLLIFTIAACTEKKSNLSTETDETVAEEGQPLPLLDLRNKFKYADLKSFQVDSFDWETRPGFYQELDSNTFKLVWQDGKRIFVGQGYDRDYFYSWQKRNPDLIEFVVLTQDKNNWCDLLHYCIYDKSGKAIDSFIVAAKCGDGGWAHTTTGRFISEDTYEQVWVF